MPVEGQDKAEEKRAMEERKVQEAEVEDQAWHEKMDGYEIEANRSSGHQEQPANQADASG